MAPRCGTGLGRTGLERGGAVSKSPEAFYPRTKPNGREATTSRCRWGGTAVGPLGAISERARRSSGLGATSQPVGVRRTFFGTVARTLFGSGRPGIAILRRRAGDIRPGIRPENGGKARGKAAIRRALGRVNSGATARRFVAAAPYHGKPLRAQVTT